MLEINTNMTVTIEKVVSGAWGLARTEYGVILVQEGLPEEIVKIRITAVQKKLAYAKIVEIESPHPQRITPSCSHYGTCGGCNFMHADIDLQRKLKQEWIQESFSRLGNIEIDLPPIIAQNAWDYRRRMQFHHNSKVPGVGLAARQSNEIIPLNECPIASPKLNQWITGASMETEVLPEKERFNVLDADEKILISNQFPEEGELVIKGVPFAMHVNLFFQSNPDIFEDVIDSVLSFAPTHGKALDLYCGIGLFSRFLLDHGLNVVGVEQDQRVRPYIKKNLKDINGDVTFNLVATRVEQFNFPKKCDYILVDPPRSGLSSHLRRKIKEHKPSKMTYVSCNGDTLARDMGEFIEAGATLHDLQLFDSASQTSHFELVAHLSF